MNNCTNPNCRLPLTKESQFVGFTGQCPRCVALNRNICAERYCNKAICEKLDWCDNCGFSNRRLSLGHTGKVFNDEINLQPILSVANYIAANNV
jgi:hypothetical protein